MNPNTYPMYRLNRSSGAKFLVVAVLALGVGLSPAFAQKDAPKKDVSDKVAEALGGPIKVAKDAGKIDEVLRLLEPLIQSSPPTSYDRAILVVEKAQELIGINKAVDAAPPLEEGLKLADDYHYFDQSTTLQMVLSLAQIYGSEAQAVKDAESQRAFFAKAYVYVRRYLDQSHTPEPDMEQFAATILLSQATINPSKVDVGLLKQAEVEVEKGMRMTVAPKEALYVLLLSTLQQEGELKRSADVLERLVKMSPNNKSYWQPLAQTYVQLASDGENVDDYILAILTIERAQQYGMLNTPKDNFLLVGIYLNIRQYEKAIELLDSGLRNGGIESSEENWKLLAQSYQQLHKEAKAIEALKDAAKHFPKSGEIELQIGQLYYTLDNIPDAYAYTKLGLDKGKVSKPAQSYFLLAYLAFELKKLDESLQYVQKSLKIDPRAKDSIRFLDTVKKEIEARDSAKTPSA